MLCLAVRVFSEVPSPPTTAFKPLQTLQSQVISVAMFAPLSVYTDLRIRYIPVSSPWLPHDCPTVRRGETRMTEHPCDDLRRSLPVASVQRAQLLVGAVRDRDPDTVQELLEHGGTADLYALAVTLAAMVPDDLTPAELLAWNDEQRYVFTPAPRGLAPHGTHSAFNRHRSDGSYPCSKCWDAERTYQRNRGRRRRAVRLVSAGQQATA